MSPPREFAADAADWFRVAEYEPGLHLIGEPGHVFSWLIHGSERSLLLDTGLGVADIAAAVEPLLDSPPLVVNSHTHFDHVGGNELFDETAMHELGPDWVEAGTSEEFLRGYERIAPAMEPGWQRLRAIDREDWFLIGPDEEVRRWPGERLGALGWRIDPPPPTQLLADGDTVSLGDRALTVIHTPGHAPDHICLLDERAGILFAQDQLYYGPQLICEPGSDLAAYTTSLRRLADELAGAIRVVYVAHCLRPALPPTFIADIAAAAESVAAGEASLLPAEGLFGEPVTGANFGHFSILVSEEAKGGLAI